MLKKLFKSKKAEAEAEEISELARLAGERAEYFFSTQGLSCSEASLLVINRGFAGGLATEQALALGNGFGGGIGGSGCVCGAISGAVMALGLFLAPGKKGALGKKRLRKLVGKFNDRFRHESGTICCRDLIADFRKDRKGRSAFCSGLTGKCTTEAVRIILAEKPELVVGADIDFLKNGR